MRLCVNCPTSLSVVSHENAIIATRTEPRHWHIFSIKFISNARMHENTWIWWKMVILSHERARSLHYYYILLPLYVREYTRSGIVRVMSAVLLRRSLLSDRLIDVYYLLLLISFVSLFFFAMDNGQPCQLVWPMSVHVSYFLLPFIRD